MITRTIQLATISAIYCISAPAQAQQGDWMYVLTADLVSEDFHLKEFSIESGLSCIDRSGLEQTISTNNILACWFAPYDTPAASISSDSLQNSFVVKLTDGQRFRLVIDEPTNEDMVTGTRIDGNGRVSIPIDRITAISKYKQTDRRWSTDDDAIILINGDRLDGFILTVAQSVQIETNTGIRNVRLDLIDAIQINNPKEHTPGIYIHTGIGERIRVRTAKINADRVLLIAPDDTIYAESHGENLQLAAPFTALERKLKDQYLINPTTQSPISVSATDDRNWIPQPITSTHSWTGTDRTSIKIPTPAAVRWSIPPNSARFGVTLRTDSRPWTDNIPSFIAINSAGDETIIWSARLTHESDFQDINELLPNDTVAIELRVDAGNYGPIQDTVWMLWPRLLVNGSPQFE